MAADCKVVYEQTDVFVHTSVPASTAYDNIIRGRVQVIEKPDGAYIDWKPVDLCSEVDFEVKNYCSGKHEYGFVDTRPQAEGEQPNASALEGLNSEYTIHFPASKIHSVRRSDPKLIWSYIVFILKDGTTQPGLHFHNGGITELIRRLQRYVWLIKSATNPKVYIAEASPHPSGASIDQLHLFGEASGDNVAKLLNTAYYGTMIGFAKVSQYVLGNVGSHGNLLDRRPRSASPRSVSPMSTTPRSGSPLPGASDSKMEDGSDQGFEILDDKPPTLADPVDIELELPLQPEEWCSFMNEDGVIQDVDALKERILKGGIHTDIRREVWKFLLGMYDFNSTYQERLELRERKSKEYETMQWQWKSISEEQEKRFSDFSQRKQLAYKDAIRTDRDHDFYRGDENENVQRLYRILMTYSMYNFDLGYVQGMSDLLSPILLLMEDEIDSFWCFTGLMEHEQRNFEMVQLYMKSQLSNLYELLKFLYPRFARYLESKECSNLYFCFKWLLINFKREFNFQDIMTIWEVSWVQNYTPHFKLFLCVAILEENKGYMMENNYGFNDILKHINSISMKLELGYVLKRALSLILQLQATKNLPENIRQIVFNPDQLPEREPPVRVNEPDTEIQIENNKKVLYKASANNNGASVSPSTTPQTTVRSSDETVELKDDSNTVF